MFKIGDKVMKNSKQPGINLNDKEVFTVINISTYSSHTVLGLTDSRGHYRGCYYQDYLVSASPSFVGPLPKYHTICTKVKEMQEKRKEKGYAF